MRKEITSGGGQREPLYGVWGLPHFFRRRLWGLMRQETPLASGQVGFPLAFRGHWVPGFRPAGFGTQQSRYKALPGSLTEDLYTGS